MDIGSSTSDTASLSVLKRALELQKQSAQTLIDSIPQPAAQNQTQAPAPVDNLPPHLGRNINTTA